MLLLESKYSGNIWINCINIRINIELINLKNIEIKVGITIEIKNGYKIGKYCTAKILHKKNSDKFYFQLNF